MRRLSSRVDGSARSVCGSKRKTGQSESQKPLGCSKRAIRATLSSMWVVIRRFATIGEAESARSALEAAGIPSDIADENTIAIDWLYSNALGGVKVLVEEQNAAEADEVLTLPADLPDPSWTEPSAIAGDPAVPSTIEATIRRCPACASDGVVRIPRLALFAALAVIAFGLAVAVGHPALGLTLVLALALITAAAPACRCASCGERWTERARRDGSARPTPGAIRHEGSGLSSLRFPRLPPRSLSSPRGDSSPGGSPHARRAARLGRASKVEMRLVWPASVVAAEFRPLLMTV